MHVLLLAWCASAVHYLSALRASGAQVSVLTGSGAPAAAPLGSESGETLPVTTCADANAPDVLRRLAERRPDLVVVAGWPRILGQDFLDIARLGVVNAHPSMLPEYRGRHPLFWTLLNGDRRAGITLHRVTRDVDAGPILLQRSIPVADDATARSLAAALDEVGAGLLVELLGMLHGGELPPGRLSSDRGSYHPPVSESDVEIDWSGTAGDVDRLIRAAAGTRPAHTAYGELKVIVDEASPKPAGEEAPPGQVVGIGADGMTVAVGCGEAIVLRRLRFFARPHTGLSVARHLGIEVGARLGIDGRRVL